MSVKNGLPNNCDGYRPLEEGDSVLDIIESKNPQEIFDYCMDQRRMRIKLERRIIDMHTEIDILKKNMQTMCAICSKEVRV